VNKGFLTTEDLRIRWKKKSRRTVRGIIKRYRMYLEPAKIGREYLVHPDRVEVFEGQMRKVNHEKV